MPIIENFKHGWKTDLQPFISPTDSFPELYNCVSDNGSVLKKKGLTIVGVTARFYTVNFNINPATGNVLSYMIAPTGTSASDRRIIPGTLTARVDESNPPTSPMNLRDDGNGNVTIIGAPGSVGTIDYRTGALSVTFPQNYIPGFVQPLTVYHYPFNASTGVVNTATGKVLYFDTRNSYSTISDADVAGFSNVYRLLGLDSNYQQNSLQSSANQLSFSGVERNLFSGSVLDTTNTFITNGVSGDHFFPITQVSGSTIRVNHPPGQVGIGDVIHIVGRSESFNGLTAVITSSSAGAFTVSGLSAGNNLASGGYVQLVNRSRDRDGIKVYNGTGYINFSPRISSSMYLKGARFIIPFMGRVLFLNVLEGAPGSSTATSNPLKIIYSPSASAGAFYYGDYSTSTTGLSNDYIGSVDAYTSGGGGNITLDRGGAIRFAQVLNGKLILGLDRGAVEVVASSSASAPFTLQYFDSVLGAFSSYGFAHLDSYIMSVGMSGIFSIKPRASLLSSLFEISRNDRDIVDEYKRISTISFREQSLHMIRDTYDERVYINFKSDTSTINNRSIVYNYRYNTYSLFRERFNCSGVASRVFPNSITGIDAEARGAELSIGGTLQGAFFARGAKQASDPDVIITNIVADASPATTSTVTAPSHALEVGEYVYFSGTNATFEGGGNIFMITAISNNSRDFTIDGRYTGTNPSSVRCTLIDNFRIRTVEINPFKQNNKRSKLMATYLMEVDPGIGFQINRYNFFNRTTPRDSKELNSTNKGGEINPSNIRWFKDITFIDGDVVQIGITLSDVQMRNIGYHRSCHCLHGIQLKLEPSGSIQ